jgi:molybdopterin molybdotransferase
VVFIIVRLRLKGKTSSISMEFMIAVQRAKELIRECVTELPSRSMPLHMAAGLTLAEDVMAPYSIPAYPQSSMDGYALAHNSVGGDITLVGEMAAGSHQHFQLQKGEAIRIFTGAAVPAGADTVVIQEKSKAENGRLIIEDAQLKCGDNVRPVGSEIEKGATAMRAGDVLTPAAIGFLAGMGIASVKVYPRPKVSIIVTGNELQHPGEPLQYGQVYEANSFTLLAALEQLHIGQVPVQRSPDDLATLKHLLEQALQQSDVVLMTGGVSVGDYDFTLKAFDACDVVKVFHKIKQKPGKPILFGVKDHTLVFGLPGNPASVLTCFYQYVLPALISMMHAKPLVKGQQAILTHDFKKPAGLTHFLKAYYHNGEVQLLTGQESYKLNSFARANCLAVLPEATTEIAAGNPIDIHVLP